MSEVQHSIKIAAQKSGLTPHVIRAWERRYDAVSPDRTDTNRRRYSDDEIERLCLLRAATHSGHSIGDVARLPIEQLKKLVTESRPVETPKPGRSALTTERAIEECLVAIRSLNTVELETVLGRAAVAFGQHGLLQRVVSPLACQVGDLWRSGVITAAHEHFASAVIRHFLVRHSKPYAVNGSNPVLVVATPAGQLHELGAVMVATAANDIGWRVVYLGTSLPALEIAGAAVQNEAQAVALSIVYPNDDPNLNGELEILRKHLPPEIKIIVGGRASASYATVLEKIGALEAGDLQELYPILDGIRATV